MDRTSRRALLAGVLGVVALGAVAAGVPVATPDAGPGGTGGPASGGEGVPAGPAGASTPVTVPPAVGAVLFLVAAGAVLWAVLDAGPARVAVPVVAALLAGLLALLGAGEAGLPVGDLGGPAGTGIPGAAPTGGDGGGTAVSPVLLVAAAVGALAVPAALWTLGREGDPTPGAKAPGDDAEARAAVARAAGRAADRIETGEGALDNEVYRCWRAMTRPLSASRATSPGEFEAAAVDRGVDPDHARELTALFERVRYGDHAPTEGDERRAVDLLRRVEAAYGGGAADRLDGASDRGDGGDERDGGPADDPVGDDPGTAEDGGATATGERE